MICSSTILRLTAWLVFNEISALALALPRTKDYRGTGEVVSSKNGVATEPTCEELKAMWRFSKRQSRAAEITNEIPMYRDPFADNVWEPYYATSRSIGGMRMGRYRSKPIYGRVVHNPPYLRIQDPAERHKAFEEVARLYGMPRQNEPRRRLTTFRLPGGGHLPTLGIPPQQGSFQHLKELIKTERARELQQQRVAEEAAARAAALKDLSRNENHRNQAGIYEHYDFDSEEDDMGSSYMGNGGSSNGGGGVISFPDLLAPAARPQGQNPGIARFVPDYSYTRSGIRTRTHAPTLFDASSFNNGYNGYIL
ncbi:uncharacterized protein LOC108907371 isoform X2 [Anoplophora glabripennis]|uniref:uncharacterized protein LOC108907371 isoform X2 n=1 Tax=Anoplophora glabripennis TaxID=217634 RepID=UPI000874492A|nr:uncharacterized protein LOC108907371 isoform X2 [Anoplophora glabripennis]